MKKLRLLLFEDCNRKCAGCCNKDWNLKTLEVETDFTQYDTIMLTGGEPLLKPDVVLKTIKKIRKQNKRANIYMYTAMVDNPKLIAKVLEKLDGITLTLHTHIDGRLLNNVNNELIKSKVMYKNKSLKLNIFSGVTVYFLDKIFWNDIKEHIEWIKDCPLPEGEVFKRLEESK